MRTFALGLIFFAMLVLAAGYASAFLPAGPPPVMPWIFALATALAMIAVLLLGASRKRQRLGPLKWVFAFCFLCVGGGFCLALATDPVTSESRLWAGLPAGAAIVLFVVGLLPMLILPIAYALTFENTTLNDDDLAELRSKLQALRGERSE